MRVLFKTDYNQDIKFAKHGGYVFWYGLLLAAVLVAPFALDTYWINELTRVLIYALAGLGLMVVTGFTGQVSLGHASLYGHWCLYHAFCCRKVCRLFSHCR